MTLFEDVPHLGRWRSTIRLALLMFCAWFRHDQALHDERLEQLERHLASADRTGAALSCGPTTMTERPE